MAAGHQQDPGRRGTSRRALLAGSITGAAGLAIGAACAPRPRRPGSGPERPARRRG